jgi:mono/diheme cytochrome c family protein
MFPNVTSVVALLSLAFLVDGSAQQQALTAPTDAAAVERGTQLLAEQCGFCHGTNARGGSGGPDLTRSVLVQEDESGKQLNAFLQVGRPDRGMPKFDLQDAQVQDLAAFLHSAIYLNANRRLYKVLDIVVGDPKAGEAYFNGAGGCRSCHSPTGDLKSVGAKYDAAKLQERILLPRGRVAARTRDQGPRTDQGPTAGRSDGPLYKDPTAVRATVTPAGAAAGDAVTGALVRLTEFEVTIFDASSGRTRSWLRNGDNPKIVVTDPLQAHVDRLAKWTDADMHNMTAYLVSLK